MKIGIVLDQKLHNGGGFQQSFNAIQQMTRICPEWIRIEVFTTIEENVSFFSSRGFSVRLVSSSFGERFRRLLLSRALPPQADILLSHWNVMTSIEKIMQASGVDLAYFVGPSPYAISMQNIPFILTVWDLCHRDFPEFPEVSSGGEFFRRENFYRNAINAAFLVLTDSTELSRRIVSYYGTDQDRILAMPFSPADFVSLECGDLGETEKRLALPKDFLFYPAQFWSHKNHIRILQALSLLKQKGKIYPVVFCGSDKGNMKYVKKMMKELGVADQVHILGFVENKDMSSLYRLSRALVMPTYFGPTNLPPLEAWSFGKPVIYSSHLASQVGDAALCVNPDSAEDLANCIDLVYTNTVLVEDLVCKGRNRMNQLESMRLEAEIIFLEKLKIFNRRLECWSRPWQ